MTARGRQPAGSKQGNQERTHLERIAYQLGHRGSGVEEVENWLRVAGLEPHSSRYRDALAAWNRGITCPCSSIDIVCPPARRA